MRMRKKKNLEKRLAKISDYLISCKNENPNQQKVNEEQHYIDFENIFKNTNPLVLEVGCGQGSFACEYAKIHMDRNIIAVDCEVSALLTGCEKAKRENIKNIIFLLCGAEYLPSYIKKNSISEIYLNFSCPYPKPSYAKHRLTHERFLNIYREIMKDNCVIFQKTDSRLLFEFSIESFSQAGFKLSNISLDLHNSDFKGNIMTEYEKKFTEIGKPIYRLEARLG